MIFAKPYQGKSFAEAAAYLDEKRKKQIAIGPRTVMAYKEEGIIEIAFKDFVIVRYHRTGATLIFHPHGRFTDSVRVRLNEWTPAAIQWVSTEHWRVLFLTATDAQGITRKNFMCGGYTLPMTFYSGLNVGTAAP